MAKTSPELCNDAEGFDRSSFHKQLDAQALEFFRKHLAP
jgi:predicted dienelactone hydrolase